MNNYKLLPVHSYYLLWHSKFQNDPAHRWFRDQSFLLLQQHLKDTYNVGKLNHHVMDFK